MNNFDSECEHKRALRRHHRARMIGRARVVVESWVIPEDDPGRMAARIHDHLKSCSCWMCGNPRRYCGERTLQEIRTAALPRRGGRGLLEERD